VQKLEDYLTKINEWEYCYCRNCDKIRYSFELEATESGIRCSRCGGYALEAPGWVHCPHEKVGAVKCPRTGSGIRREKYEDECKYRCSFRKP
jgi:hypothetical protein